MSAPNQSTCPWGGDQKSAKEISGRKIVDTGVQRSTCPFTGEGNAQKQLKPREATATCPWRSSSTEPTGPTVQESIAKGPEKTCPWGEDAGVGNADSLAYAAAARKREGGGDTRPTNPWHGHKESPRQARQPVQPVADAGFEEERRALIQQCIAMGHTDEQITDVLQAWNRQKEEAAATEARLYQGQGGMAGGEQGSASHIIARRQKSKNIAGNVGGGFQAGAHHVRLYMTICSSQSRYD